MPTTQSTGSRRPESPRRNVGGDLARAAQEPAEQSRPARTRGLRDSAAVTTSGRIVTVRLSREEFSALEALQTRTGASSRSDVLRALVRAGVGMLEFDPEQARQMGEIRAELHRIGVNVNQIALAANRGRVDLVRQEWAAINELRQALPRLRTWLNAVVDEQRRRGVRLFRAFCESGQ